MTLALRQQALLQGICAVRERIKAAGHQLGLTSAPHTESVAAPQLARKVPSHLNNMQLRALLCEAGASDGINATPLYPLSKLLVLVIVRDLQRFISSGANCGHDESTALAAKANTGAAAAAAASAFATSISPSSAEDDLSTLSLAALLHRLVRRVCCIDLSAASVAQMLLDGPRLATLSLQVDKETRVILNEEPYDLSPGVDNLAPSAAFTQSSQAFHAKQSRSWFASGVSPFAHFQFTRPPAGLGEAERVLCPQCQKPSALYCPYCLLPTLPPALQIPPVRLPMHVDIIHHVGENVKKSTSIHGCILAPDFCRFLEFPADLPPGGYDPASTVLLYPTPDAVFLDDPRVDLLSVKRVLVIESTWSKSDVVSSHPALAKLRRVKIRERESTFWRYQELGRHFLSTLEAIYYICKEFQQRAAALEKEKAAASGAASAVAASSSSASSTSSLSASASSSSSHPLLSALPIDDLLYFYAFQHSRITDRYRSGENVPRSWSGGIANTKHSEAEA